ncbi:MAG: BamA/TamA family outer membrane protein [Polyangiales bacterium]
MIVLFVGIAGCKGIPADSYGIDSIRFRGMEQLDSEALRVCLATKEHPRRKIQLGATAEPECGAPPFDNDRVTLELWRAATKDWPELDLSVFERDLQRIERWYRARGYYDAQVVATRFNPPQAGSSDRVGENSDSNVKPCEPNGEGEGCRVGIVIDIVEGEPVRTKTINISGIESLPEKTKRAIRKSVELKIDEPFDETIYERSKTRIRQRLDQLSFACAKVSGSVDVDPDERTAIVDLDVESGPLSVLGEIKVSGAANLPLKPILGTADLHRGQHYVGSELEDAQRAVYGLGAFATVDIEVTPQTDESGACTGIVDVDIQVEPGRKIRWGLGGGVQAGTLDQVGQTQDARISDVHLLGLFEHRNFLGGLRRLRIEERPKAVFRNTFNGFQQFGNEIRIEFRQPGFLEPRTVFSTMLRHDWGPDPNEFFTRHDFAASARLSRSFFGGVLALSGGVNIERYLVVDGQRPDLPTTYRLFYLDQRIQLDYRDDTRSPRKGFLIKFDAQQSPILLRESWRYVRITPEARAYIPLPLHSALAFRFGIGAMFVGAARSTLDPLSRRLGPQNHRLRSGGPTSHRGFPAGFVGDAATVGNPLSDGSDARNDGGLRRWEASVEWRVPITSNFATALFSDMGDVNRGKKWRFDYLNMAVGIGFRYYTPVGPLRVDWGFLVPNAQIIGQPDPERRFRIFQRIRGGVPGAFQVTIGEAF